MKKSFKLSVILSIIILSVTIINGTPVKDNAKGVSKVYFTKDISSEGVLKVYNKIANEVKGEKIGVKIHFGEEGNQNFLNPDLVKGLMEKTNGTFIETNVLYESKRKYTESHVKLAKEHGFTFAPIDILDSGGVLEYECEDLKHFEKIKVGKNIENYDTIIVYSHFKGHGYAGFGGAIKNVSMGMATPDGKLDMHRSFIPDVDSTKCIECKLCLTECPGNAISIKPVKVDSTKCIGCGDCVSYCPAKVFTVPEKSEIHKYFLEKLVEYAKVINDNNHMIYINVIANISKYCDCIADAPQPFMDDIGIVASTDIVAIDKACLDLVNEKCKCKDAFAEQNKVSGDHQIDYANKLGLGNKKYELINLDK